MDYPLDKTSEVNMIPTIDIIATGENIKALMDEREMSVKYVSGELGFGCVQGVYKWIHGRCLPSIDNLVALSYLLQVRMEDILVLEDRG